MAERHQLARPVVRAAAGFQGNLGAGAPLEEGQHLRTTQIDAQHRPIRLIDGVQREHRLGRVDANALNLGHGRLLPWSMTNLSLALDAVGPSIPTEKLPPQ
jgi:hypothetical protein